MSVLSIGAIILLSSILVGSMAALTTAVGTTAAIASHNNQQNSATLPTNFSQQIANINFDKIKSTIKSQLTQLLSLVEKISNYQELIESKKDLKNQILELYSSPILDNLDNPVNAEKLHQIVEIIVNKYSNLKISSQNIEKEYEIKKQILNDRINKIKDLIKQNNLNTMNKELEIITNKLVTTNSLTQLNNLINELKDLQLKIELQSKFNINIEDISVEKSQINDFKKEIEEKLELSNLKEEFNRYYRELASFIREHYPQDKQIFKTILRIDLTKYKSLLNDLDTVDKTILKNYLSQLKLDFSKIMELFNKSQYYKSRLKNYLETLNNYDYSLESVKINIFPLAEKMKIYINEFLQKDIILEDEYFQIEKEFLNLSKNYEKYLELDLLNNNLKNNINKVLESIGYKTIDKTLLEKLISQEVIYLDTPFGEEYKIQLKISDGQIFSRFVKIGQSTTDYEKQKDIEFAKNWCQHYDNFIKELQKYGIFIQNIKRLEPEEVEILYLKPEEVKEFIDEYTYEEKRKTKKQDNIKQMEL